MAGLVIANWKLHGSLGLIEEFSREWQMLPPLSDVSVVLCPPAPYLGAVSNAFEDVALGAQNCADQVEGAFTGEISVQMLSELGCSYVIIGHSERRALYSETDAQVAVKAALVIAQGLHAVVCVGETLEHRDAGQQDKIVIEQLLGSLAQVPCENLVVAYEPVWAIGTGRTATPAQADAMHGVIRSCLCEHFGEVGAGIPIIYGGSVKPENASVLFECDNIDGSLVGGASLNANSFWQIASAASAGRA
jgi:triosephosphate isomerase